MELKVWVEGVVRVVCGLSLTTSCQDVVIALAQAIGQTGRYVLILKLRANERHLVAEDCPLQQLAQLGQQAAEVQFILRRTGPSLSEGPNTPSTVRRLPLPRPSEPEPLKHHKEPQKAFTFNLGPSTYPKRTKPDREQWERYSAAPWEEQLQEEIERERGKSSYKIRELQSRSAHLEQDLQLTAHSQSSRAGTPQPDEALRPLKQELHNRLQLDSLEGLRHARAYDRSTLGTIEELNKELRHCKLQQFIQQTGVTPHTDQTNSLLVNEPLGFPVGATGQTISTQNLRPKVESVWVIRAQLLLSKYHPLVAVVHQLEVLVCCDWVQCEFTGI
uniref:Ras association domain family member 7 n=1 Tax=Stegastes partitus TaxID=144197 RepID=A0A3B5AP75_9TELE